MFSRMFVPLAFVSKSKYTRWKGRGEKARTEKQRAKKIYTCIWCWMGQLSVENETTSVDFIRYFICEFGKLALFTCWKCRNMSNIYIYIYYTHVQLRNCRLGHISQKCTTKMKATFNTHVQLGQSKSFSVADTFFDVYWSHCSIMDFPLYTCTVCIDLNFEKLYPQTL